LQNNVITNKIPLLIIQNPKYKPSYPILNNIRECKNSQKFLYKNLDNDVIQTCITKYFTNLKIMTQ